MARRRQRHALRDSFRRERMFLKFVVMMLRLIAIMFSLENYLLSNVC